MKGHWEEGQQKYNKCWTMGQYAYVVYKRLELEKCLPEILKERLPSISNFKEEMTRP